MEFQDPQSRPAGPIPVFFGVVSDMQAVFGEQSVALAGGVKDRRIGFGVTDFGGYDDILEKGPEPETLENPMEAAVKIGENEEIDAGAIAPEGFKDLQGFRVGRPLGRIAVVGVEGLEVIASGAGGDLAAGVEVVEKARHEASPPGLAVIHGGISVAHGRVGFELFSELGLGGGGFDRESEPEGDGGVSLPDRLPEPEESPGRIEEDRVCWWGGHRF